MSSLILILHAGIILGVCLCQPPTQESLTLWIQYLHNDYPQLKNATIVYDVKVLDEVYSDLGTALNDFIPPFHQLNQNSIINNTKMVQ